MQEAVVISRSMEGIIARYFQVSSVETSETTTDLDSHADSPVVGDNAMILFHTNKTVRVSGFTKALGDISKVPVVVAAVAYTDAITGITYLLVISNALYMKGMEGNLIPPFMIRLTGHEVDECPKFMCKQPTTKSHAITIGDPELIIPLSLKGITSYIPTRKPTVDECKTCKYIDITPNTSDWNPHDMDYAEQESCMVDYRGELIPATTIKESLSESRIIASTMMNNDNRIYHDTELSMIISSVESSCNPRLLSEKVVHRYRGEDTFSIKAVGSTEDIEIQYKELSDLWNISLEVARRTIKATTQLCLRSSDIPSLSKRYITNDRMLRYPRISCNIFTDTFFANKEKCTSTRGNDCCQLFVSEFGFAFGAPMKGGSQLCDAYKKFFKEIGVPPCIICDSAPNQIQGEARKLCNLCSCTIKSLEKGTPSSNRAECYVGLVKSNVKKDLKMTNSPLVLWDYCVERRCKILSASARDIYLLDGMVPYTKMTGQPYDISNLCLFSWYDWVYYRDTRVGGFPLPSESLGRCLGPADHAGNAMSQWVLNNNGKILPYQTLRRLTKAEIANPYELEKRDTFDTRIKSLLGTSIEPPPSETPELTPYYEDSETPPHEMPEADLFKDYDRYLNAEVLLPQDGEHLQAARVVKQSLDSAGNNKGESHNNPMLDTRIYDVMFPDGAIRQYSANSIAENMYSQVDQEGNTMAMLDTIIDHRRDESAIRIADATDKTRFTTKGWYLKVQWKDGTGQWIPLKDIKESNPVSTAEYALSNDLMDEPAFKWWAAYTLKKRDHIICAIVRRKKKGLKYGIKVPETVAEAYRLDTENVNTFWKDAIIKEMKNVSIAFSMIEEGSKPPPGYKHVGGRIIFDVKMDFTRKARWVAAGHKTPDPIRSTYAGVVSRESVRIAFTYAALNDLDVFAADIQNAYLQAPCSEKYYITCGIEWGPDLVGRQAKIVRALYGLKSSGADFRNHLRDCMEHLGFLSCLGDDDVWRRPALKTNGDEYWEYILLYTDDCLVISEFGEDILRKELKPYFKLKEESIGHPTIYLGGKVSKVVLPNGVEAWAFSASQYVQEAVAKVEAHLKKQNMKLCNKAILPLVNEYRPEIDQSRELDDEGVTYYQSWIGVLRWIVELGRVDICCEVSMLSSHLCLPREGHLQQVYHIFAYLKANHNARLVFDPSYLPMDPNQFERKDWRTFYENVTEELPPGAPPSKGKGFIITAYVDADYAGDSITRQSRTGYIFFINNAPVYWMSKKQNSVETSTYGSKFTAIKHCTEYIRGLRFRLRMMGIPCEDPAFVYGDNKSVLCNATIPYSTLNKKSNSIDFLNAYFTLMTPLNVITLSQGCSALFISMFTSSSL